jgi:P27 family predicted phage terminase small subunit
MKQKIQTPKAPAHLGPAGKAAWRRYQREYGVDDDALPILEQLCNALDRQAEARAIIAAEGMIDKDRFKQKRAHPAVAIERDARLAALRAMRMLGLPLREEAEKRKPGRPTAFESLQRVK